MSGDIDFKGRRVYLDTNTLIYFVENHPNFGPKVRPLMQMIDEGKATGVTSELTLAEVLVKPLRDKNMLVAQVYEALLAGSNKLTVVPISREILRLSAHVRAVARANRLFDSIHVATAMQSGCHAFVTEDDRIRTIDDLPIVLVRDMPSHG